MADSPSTPPRSRASASDEKPTGSASSKTVPAPTRRSTSARAKTAKKKTVTKKKATTRKKTVTKKTATKKKAATKAKPVKTRATTKRAATAQRTTARRTTGTKAAPKAKAKSTAKDRTAGPSRKRASPKRKATSRRERSETIDPAVTPAATPEVAASASPPKPTRRQTRRRSEEPRKASHEPVATPPPEAQAPPPSPQQIPPLPEEEDEFVPFEEASEREPLRQVPPDLPPKDLLEGVRRGDLHVSALNQLSDEQVVGLARSLGFDVRPEERRSETLYRLLQESPPATRPTESVFVEGLLELHPDGYGFLRRPERSYVQHPDDVYVGAGLVRKLGLRAGHWVSGTARRSRPGEPLLALQQVEEVNHEDASAVKDVTSFENLTVVYPDQRFLLEVAPEDYEMRVMDLFCPLGRGQRALIVSPPRAGKTVILQKLADAIAHNSPNVDIVVLLVDERPEEVTNMRRSVRGEVISSTFDRPAVNHIRIAELVMEKVKRMVEFGRHVVLLLDSITRLGRAYNNTAGQSGRILTGGLEAKALTKPKRFFGAARNIEDGGSLTIVATALVDTGSRMDEVIFEEFKGSGNMEIVLDRHLANARIWPAINVPASGTRNEDLLLHPEELRRVNLLRKAMTGQSPQGVMEAVRDQMNQYRTNAELLMSLG